MRRLTSGTLARMHANKRALCSALTWAFALILCAGTLTAAPTQMCAAFADTQQMETTAGVVDDDAILSDGTNGASEADGASDTFGTSNTSSSSTSADGQSAANQGDDSLNDVDAQPENLAAGVPDNVINEAQLPDTSFLYDASIVDLANADSYMDGQTVQVTGEVVGDCIAADFDSNYCWITLQATDGTYAEVEVCMTVSAAGVIDTYGAYGKRGTVLQVRGVFNLACADHEGLSDLHADNVALMERGQVTEQHAELGKFALAGGFFLTGAGLLLLYKVLEERRR